MSVMDFVCPLNRAVLAVYMLITLIIFPNARGNVSFAGSEPTENDFRGAKKAQESDTLHDIADVVVVDGDEIAHLVEGQRVKQRDGRHLQLCVGGLLIRVAHHLASR
jgi:hypothetical protein